jgi:hypothetical protein
MSEYIKRQKNMPWVLKTYTDVSQMLQSKERAALLVVSESAFCDAMTSERFERVVILSEGGLPAWDEAVYVDKYDSAESVYAQLVGIFAEVGNLCLSAVKGDVRARFIGNYSPVRRSMQTSFALSLAQLLAKKHRTIYLNFEYCCGLGDLLPDMQTLDLADLLYFLNASEDCFSIRLRTMTRHLGGLDYIPPVKSGDDLLKITCEEWISFLKRLAKQGAYEYVVLDLSESMQGLFEILRLCCRVFTCDGQDWIAKKKMMHYEQLLEMREYGDVLEKTDRVDLTHIHRIPQELEQLTRGDLADIAAGILCGLEEVR